MSDYEPIVEKLDIKPGDLVLVLVPRDLPDDQLESIGNSFGELLRERDASAIIAPDFLRFRVVREDDA